VALAFAAAALLSCWNLFAAPLGLAVGLASLLLGLRARRRGLGSRRLAGAAVALGAVAAATSLVVLALGASAVTSELPGEPVARGRTPAEAAALLEEEARRTAAARARALRELEQGGARDPAAAPGRAREDGPLEGGGEEREREEDDETE
jgi:hypothetical protein